MYNFYVQSPSTNFYVQSLSNSNDRFYLNFLLNGGLLIREYGAVDFTNAGSVVPYVKSTLDLLIEKELVKIVRGNTITYLAPTEKVLEQETSVNWWVE